MSCLQNNSISIYLEIKGSFDQVTIESSLILIKVCLTLLRTLKLHYGLQKLHYEGQTSFSNPCTNPIPHTKTLSSESWTMLVELHLTRLYLLLMLCLPTPSCNSVDDLLTLRFRTSLLEMPYTQNPNDFPSPFLGNWKREREK